MGSSASRSGAYLRARAAVVREKGGPFSVEAVELDEPRPGEVLVRIEAVGVCHTDLIARDLYYPMPLPIVLGHEGAGVVERVGPGVRAVRPGDRVVLSYRSCTRCASCLAGLPGYCERIQELTYLGAREDGSTAIRSGGAPVHSHFFGQSSFAEYALATEANVVPVPSDVPAGVLAPLGCGVQTGVGAVIEALRPRAGSGIVVAGAGSVGLSAVMAAAVVGCDPVVVLERSPARRRLALELGATHAPDPAGVPPADLVRQARPGGVAHALDTTGAPELIAGLVDALAPRGTCGLIAGTPTGTQLRADMNTVLFGGRTIRGIIGGDAAPGRLVPAVLALWRAGKLPVERLVTTFPLARIEDAVAATERGEVVKAVLDPWC